MSLNNLLSRLRAPNWASIAVFAALAAGCSKENAQASSSQSAASTPTASAPASSTPAASTPAANLPPPSPIPASATLVQVISLARAAIGPEDKLNAVSSLVMTGVVADDKKQVIGTVLMINRKPGFMRTEAHRADQNNVEGSNGVIGWTIDQDLNNNKRVAFLSPARETQNTYNTFENLYFYRGALRVPGARITDDGEVQYRNAKCRKVSFIYPNGETYVRFFEAATGRLHGTIMLPSGSETLEDGVLMVDGIAFPQTIANYNKDGKLTQVIKFDRVAINPPMDLKVFDLPSLQAITARVAKPAATAATAATTAPAATAAAKPATGSGSAKATK